MSHEQIIAELPKLNGAQRQDLLERLCDLQDQDLLFGPGPTEGEKQILDAEQRQFDMDGDIGSPWDEVRKRIWPGNSK